jgi:hypothetical protein
MEEVFHGPRYLRKQRQPWGWSEGIIPPPLDVSIASNMETTSSISGRLSGLASQHLFITFPRALGQQRGISGLRFCYKRLFTFQLSMIVVIVKTITNVILWLPITGKKKLLSIYRERGGGERDVIKIGQRYLKLGHLRKKRKERMVIWPKKAWLWEEQEKTFKGLAVEQFIVLQQWVRFKHCRKPCTAFKTLHLPVEQQQMSLLRSWDRDMACHSSISPTDRY